MKSKCILSIGILTLLVVSRPANADIIQRMKAAECHKNGCMSILQYIDPDKNSKEDIDKVVKWTTNICNCVEKRITEEIDDMEADFIIRSNCNAVSQIFQDIHHDCIKKYPEPKLSKPLE